MLVFSVNQINSIWHQTAVFLKLSFPCRLFRIFFSPLKICFPPSPHSLCVLLPAGVNYSHLYQVGFESSEYLAKTHSVTTGLSVYEGVARPVGATCKHWALVHGNSSFLRVCAPNWYVAKRNFLKLVACFVIKNMWNRKSGCVFSWSDLVAVGGWSRFSLAPWLVLE